MRPGRVPVLWITGPAGVGKSTIGFQLYLRCRRAGLTAGYIDLDQIGFLAPQPNGDPLNHRFKARNLAVIWRTFHAAGASHLVISGPVDSQAVLRAYAAALPATVITACRLHAGPAELRRRIMTRGAGAAGLSRETRCADSRKATCPRSPSGQPRTPLPSSTPPSTPCASTPPGAPRTKPPAC